MACTINFRNQRGFSLIEGMFSALILAIALLGLAGFHAAALQDGSLVKARSVASNLAQEKLDDLRGFTRLMDDALTTGVNECDAPTFCFSEIAANAGGREDASGNLVLPSGTKTGYADNYSLDWTVLCSPEAAGSALSFSTTCNTATVAKLVTVRLTWTDSKNASQSTSLQGVIYALDPAKMALAAARAFSTQKPKAGYTPIGVPDAVPVPISTGDGKFKESSKPLPDVSSKGYSLRTEFDSVSYTTTGGSSKKDSQLEFSTVSCVCEFAGNGSGYPASYFTWDGSGQQIKVPDATVTKMTGTAPTIQGDKQDDLCTACCRDHHDSEAPGASSPTTALYDPDRPSSDYVGNDHKHYYYANPNSPQNGLVEVTASAGNRYLEACRFARVDGIQRLLQDWRALDMVVIPYNNYLNDSGKLEAYQNYLIDYLSYQARVDCTAAGATGCTGISQSTVPSKSDLATRNLANQSTGTPNQLLARALYADRVYSTTAPRTLDADYYSALASRVSANQTWLDRLPFNEVNVTLLANWASSNTSVVTVTNETISDIQATTADYYGVYSRGSTAIVAGDGGDANITAYLLPSNSGLTGGVTRAPFSNVEDYDSSLTASGTISYAGPIGIDRDDHRSGKRVSDYLNIGRASTSSPNNSGSIRMGNASAKLLASTDATLSSPSTSCVIATPLGGVTTYSCTITSGYTGTLTIATATAGAFFDVGSDAIYDTESTTVPETTCGITSGAIDTACKNFWIFGPTANVQGKCSGTECANSTFASKLNGTGADVACTLTGNDVTCPVTLNTSTKTWSGTIKITGNGTTIYVSASSTCGSSDGTGAKVTATINAGPADKPAAFDVCATTVAAPPTIPAVPTGLGLSTAGTTTTFSWGDVANETGYAVYRCDIAGSGACSPSALVSSPAANATSVGQTRPSNNQTSCFNIKASNAGGSSAASQTMCVHRSGSTYTNSGPF